MKLSRLTMELVCADLRMGEGLYLSGNHFLTDLLCGINLKTNQHLPPNIPKLVGFNAFQQRLYNISYWIRKKIKPRPGGTEVNRWIWIPMAPLQPVADIGGHEKREKRSSQLRWAWLSMMILRKLSSWSLVKKIKSRFASATKHRPVTRH